MYLIETGVSNNVIGVHNAPLKSIEEWQLNGVAVYEIDEETYTLVNGRLGDVVYDGVTVADRLTVIADPNPVAVDAVVTVTATLPEGSTDAEVTFQVEGEDAIVEVVAGLQAARTFSFALLGTYRITVSSATRGSRVVKVVVE